MRPVAPLRAVRPSAAPSGAGRTLPNICLALFVVGKAAKVTGGEFKERLSTEEARKRASLLIKGENYKRALCVAPSAGRMEEHRAQFGAQVGFS